MGKRTAVIIGASSDIGKRVAERLKKSWNVYGTYNKHRKDLEKLIGKSCCFRIDLSTENSRQKIKEMVKKIWQTDGRIDAGVYVACIWNPFFNFLNEDEDKTKEMWNVNYFGAYWFFRELVPYIIQTKNGSFVAVGSTTGVKGSPHAETYGATKAALINLMISLSEELANYGIRANVISPGPVNTKAFRQYYPSSMDLMEIQKNIPMSRLAESENVAKAIAYFLEDDYVTRQNILLDGAGMF